MEPRNSPLMSAMSIGALGMLAVAGVGSLLQTDGLAETQRKLDTWLLYAQVALTLLLLCAMVTLVWPAERRGAGTIPALLSLMLMVVLTWVVPAVLA